MALLKPYFSDILSPETAGQWELCFARFGEWVYRDDWSVVYNLDWSVAGGCL